MSAIFRRFTVLAALTCCPFVVVPQIESQASTSSAQDQIVRQMQQEIGLDNAAPNVKNPDGLHINFIKISDVDFPDGHFIRYRMLLKGAPKKQDFKIAVWRIGQQIRYTNRTVYLNAQGLVMLHEPTAEQDQAETADKSDEYEIELKVARGEPVRYMLFSQAGNLFYPGTIVPYPIENQDGKCTLEARLGYPEAQTLIVYAGGLPAGTQIPLQAVSEGETHTSILHANPLGHADAIVVPYVAGKDAGVVKLSLKTASCKLSIEVPWGKGSYHSP